MKLFEQIEKVLQGSSRFTVKTPISFSPPKVDFTPYQGFLIFWPFPNTAEAVYLFFQALNDGVIPILEGPKMPEGKKKELRDAYPHFGLCKGSTISLPKDAVKGDKRLLFVLMTSGSTGTPKLIGASAKGIEKAVQAIDRAQGLQKVSSTALLLPLCYSYALVNQLFWSVYFEKTLVMPPPLTFPQNAFEFIQSTGAEMLCMVGSQIQMLRSMGFDQLKGWNRVKVVNFAGAPFPIAHYESLKKWFPEARFINNYGCTEAMPRLTAGEVTDSNHPITYVGKPIGDIQLRIAGDEAGPIQFQGSSTSLGTVQKDGSVKENAEWIDTNDTGKLEKGGLHVFGRHDQVINIGGERISLLEIEQALLHCAMENSLVWTDEKGTLAIIQGAQEPSKEQISQVIKGYLTPIAWPKKIYWVSSWPVNANGKTDRTWLQQAAQEKNLKVLWESPYAEA